MTAEEMYRLCKAFAVLFGPTLVEEQEEAADNGNPDGEAPSPDVANIALPGFDDELPF